VSYEIHYLSAVTNSASVSDLLEEEIEALSKKRSEAAVKAAGLNVDSILYPVKTVLKDCSSNESSVGSILGSVLPFLLITSILLGSMYPAIDTTAGEKERGTLETLLTLPVRNIELIMSKFLSVATITVISVFINILSISGIVAYMYAAGTALAEDAGEFHVGSFVPAILISIVCVMAFALFISAVVMCICAFAKSFKEANNYITPLTLVVMLTGYIGFIPNVELSQTTALIPVANICLLIKNLLVFKYDFTLILMVLLSNILYAFLAVWFLAKIYNSESILFGESMSSIKLFERRKNIKKGSLPSVAEGLLVLVVALLLMVYLGGILSLKYPIAGVIIPQLFIGVLPVLACLYIKAEPKKVFRLNSPKPKHVLGAVLMWLGAGSGTLILSNLLSYAFPDSSQSLNEEYMTILEGVPFVGALILIALVPAVCEELMYRGYLFTALKQKMKLPVAIFIVSLLFGISHMSLIKLLPTMLLGVALAYTIEQTDSLVNSSLIHFLNNGFAVFTMYYGDRFTWLSDENMGVPLAVTMVVLFVVATPLSVLCLRKKNGTDM
jgi:sodium transport system permease protein